MNRVGRRVASIASIASIASFATFATLALFASTSLTGCRSKESGAKEDFSRDVTCPEDRVSVRARPDLKPSDWLDTKKPPADIAKDPARLEMWQAKQDEARAWKDGRDEIFEASGCGETRLYACHRHNKNTNQIMCSHMSDPPKSKH